LNKQADRPQQQVDAIVVDLCAPGRASQAHFLIFRWKNIAHQVLQKSMMLQIILPVYLTLPGTLVFVVADLFLPHSP
jgi:hypothetical protein